MIDRPTIQFDQGNLEATPEVAAMAEKAINATKFLLANLPPRHRFYTFNMETIMIACGFKAGTEGSISLDKFDKDEFQREIEIYAKLGLKLSSPIYSEFQSDAGLTRSYDYYLYNPEVLMAQTRNSELVLPFSADMTIEQWIEQNYQEGKKPSVVFGKICSYPESAIRDFDLIQDHQKAYATGAYAFSEEVFPLNVGDGGNDSFMFKLPASAEIVKREKDKFDIFQIWSRDKEIASLLDSNIIEESRRLFWGKPQ